MSGERIATGSAQWARSQRLGRGAQAGRRELWVKARARQALGARRQLQVSSLGNAAKTSFPRPRLGASQQPESQVLPLTRVADTWLSWLFPERPDHACGKQGQRPLPGEGWAGSLKRPSPGGGAGGRQREAFTTRTQSISTQPPSRTASCGGGGGGGPHLSCTNHLHCFLLFL